MDTIWLVLALPLLGSLLCATHYRTLGKAATGMVASLAILGAFVASVQTAYQVQLRHEFTAHLSSWLHIPGISGLDFAALADPLSATMLCTVTGVAFLIHCFSMGYMADEEDYGRFFASLNLFVATMVLLVMANNLALMLVGWGGVGYASYSLIGFYRQKPSAVSAARKAFLINVVGDVALMFAIFIIATHCSTLEFKAFLQPDKLDLLGGDLILAGLCLMVGAYAKSAQLPLHTWLPDAMEGPTPVSALIHAATMVTAGVYLMVRCAPLFRFVHGQELLPMADDLNVIMMRFGAATALLAALCAIAQNDLKRILAYSTMSQLGYMFMAAGAGAYGAAIFHLVTHAFFKALLFLTAGVVIHALHGEQDIRKMGGLGKKMVGVQLAFLIGSLALAGIPPLAGFFSKESILLGVFGDGKSVEHELLWAVGILTALLTSYYTGRAYVLTFWAPAQHEGKLHYPSSSMTWPLAVLALATVAAGFGGHDLIQSIQGQAPPEESFGGLQLTALAVGVVGLGVAYSTHRSGRQRLVPEGADPYLRGCEAIDGLTKSLAASFRGFADKVAIKLDPVVSQVCPDLVRRSMLSTSTLLCQLQSGSLRLYSFTVLTSSTLLVLVVYFLSRFISGGGGQ
ncbi:NADH-quinone oxidoreductase subunit L [bacterium]|nr:NADH-quinone oxidoreductase subunit L [bacterium]